MTDTPTPDRSATEALLAERYGSRARRPRALWLSLLGAVLALALAGLAWATYVHANPKVASSMVGFTIVDEHRTTAEISILFSGVPAGQSASCTLRAVAADHTSVGDLNFTVAARENADGFTDEYEIRTEREATSVDLIGCVTKGQQRRH